MRIGLQVGFILFVLSEAMLFVSLFWNFMKNALYPMGEQSPITDGVWPPRASRPSTPGTCPSSTR